MDYYAAVDIGGTKATVSVASQDSILYKVRQDTCKRGPNTALPHQVDFLIGYACGQINIPKGTIAAVGISTCSPFEQTGDGRVVVSPNLCGGLAKDGPNRPYNDWKYIPLRGELLKVYKNVKDDNDCVTALVAEMLFGAAQECKDVVYSTWSTGVGFGLCVDGKILYGKNGNAGHAGHHVIVDGGPECGCGNHGDLESLTSGPSIAKAFGVGPDKTAEVFAAYRDGNSKAEQVIAAAVDHYARGLYNLVAILDTKVFVIGGSVFMGNTDLLKPIVEEKLAGYFPALTKGVEIRPSALDNHLGDIAALSLVMPKEWIPRWKETKPWERAPEAVQLELPNPD